MHSHKNLHNLTMVLTFVLLQSHSQLQFCPPESCPTLPLTILQIMYPTIVIVQTIYLPLQLSCPRLNHGEIPVGHAASSPTDNLVWHAPNVYGHSTCCNDHKEGHCSQNACCLIKRFLIEIGAFSTGSMFPELFPAGRAGAYPNLTEGIDICGKTDFTLILLFDIPITIFWPLLPTTQPCMHPPNHFLWFKPLRPWTTCSIHVSLPFSCKKTISRMMIWMMPIETRLIGRGGRR